MLCPSSPPNPNSSMDLTSRSKATQAMTLEWVKCRRPPRTSQMPSSGRCQAFSRKANSSFMAAQPPSRFLQAQALGGVDGRQDFAVDVELELPRGGVADPHRFRAFVARQPVELELGEAARAGDAVHDLRVGRIARHGPQQPVAEGARLVDVAADHEGAQRQAGVAQPAEAVVPVAHAADATRAASWSARPRCRRSARRSSP